MPISGAVVRSRTLTGNYAYVTARVRARETKLIPTEEYQKLLAMDLHEMARWLEEGAYKTEIDELSQKFRGAALVERAARLRLGRTYQEVIRMSTGELRRMLLLYLQRYDVYNVKTVLRGRYAGAPDDDIVSALIPAGALSAEELRDMLRLGSMEDVLASLKESPYGAALADAPAGGSEGLAKVENALDKRYYDLLVTSVAPSSEPKRAFLAFIRREIDSLNLKTALRLRVAGMEDLAGYFVRGGSEIAEERARRILRATPEEAARELEGTRFAKVTDAVRRTLETGNLNAAVAAIDRQLLVSARSFGNRYPLSILPVVDFVLRQRVETDNLQILAHGRETGLKEETLKELIFV